MASAICYAIMVAAAGIDARDRVFPNGLAALFIVAAGASAVVAGGIGLLVRRICLAWVACGILLLFELVWRRLHGGVAGLGMGDIKYLFGCLLLDPLLGLYSFAMGLLALAVAGLILHRPSLPLLPFAVCAYAALAALAGSGFWF